MRVTSLTSHVTHPVQLPRHAAIFQILNRDARDLAQHICFLATAQALQQRDLRVTGEAFAPSELQILVKDMHRRQTRHGRSSLEIKIPTAAVVCGFF